MQCAAVNDMSFNMRPWSR